MYTLAAWLGFKHLPERIPPNIGNFVFTLRSPSGILPIIVCVTHDFVLTGCTALGSEEFGGRISSGASSAS